MFQELLARFRALGLSYQYAHWSVKGSFFYEDHLMLERLYNDVNDQIDQIAEKGIGVTKSNTHVILGPHLDRVQALVASMPTAPKNNLELLSALVETENSLATWLTDAAAKETNVGVKNLLEQFVDDGTQRQYLLHQRVSAYE